MEELECSQEFPHFNPIETICCHGNQSSDPIWPTTKCSQSPAPIMNQMKGVRALRGYFGPPKRPKNEIRFSPNSSYRFMRTMTQVYKSDISLTFTVAMVIKMAAKTG